MFVLHLILNQIFFFTEFINLIGSTLEFIQNEISHISKSLLQTFIKFIFDPAQPASKLIYIQFLAQIQQLLSYLLENIKISTVDNFYIITRSFISAHFDSSFAEFTDKILSKYNTIEDQDFSNKFFQMILNLIGVIPIEDQLIYIDIIIKLEWSLSMKKTFTTLVPSLISCKTIFNKAKKKLISLFPTHILGTETELLKIIHTVKKFGEESGCNVLGSLIFLYIFIASESPPISVFLCFLKIEELL